MPAVTIHTVPTSLKKDTSSCEALSSHSPPHTAKNRKHSFYLGGQGCPGIIMAIVGQRECTSSATPSLPASSLFPLEWSPMSFSCPAPPDTVGCLEWVAFSGQVSALSPPGQADTLHNQHLGWRKAGTARCHHQMTGASVRVPSTGSGAETWESPFLKPGISSSSCEPPVYFQHFLYSLFKLSRLSSPARFTTNARAKSAH